MSVREAQERDPIVVMVTRYFETNNFKQVVVLMWFIESDFIYIFIWACPANISTSSQRCFNVVDQRWNSVHPTLRMKQNLTSVFHCCKTLIQRRCPTLKQRWYNLILTLFQCVLDINEIYIKTSRAIDKLRIWKFVNR